ncbi:MAG: lysylphosphatidylglycerol synthase transmembrane domain-containing protein [Anaerolineaceae bacterium]|nr:lysylphosphatidylglycerol synthase transmembrane domain-containing protein [Anaerolineaceae bacterium]HNX45294.1 lysylphosphatidylglycerol synthase transmembrane domain-containing protein [Anaerolineaceae bacterium]
MKIKRWHVWLGVLISVVFLWLAFRKVDFSLVWQYLGQANWAWVLLGLVFYFFGVALRAFRWQVLLNPLKRLPWQRLLPVVAIGYMGNNVYPARAGELLRSVLLKSKDQVDISGSLATIVVERLFDAIVILGLVLLNLNQLTSMPGAADWVGSIQKGAVIGGIVFLLLLLVFLGMVFFPGTTQKATTWLVGHLVPEKFQATLNEIVARFINGLSSLRSPLETLKVLLFSIAIWTCETGLYWGVMRAMGLDLSFLSLMLLNGVINLVLLVPAAPGGLGTFDAACKAMLVLFGVAAEQALGYTLILRVALWVPITVLGAIYFVKEGFSLKTDVGSLKEQYTPVGVPPTGIPEKNEINSKDHENHE